VQRRCERGTTDSQGVRKGQKERLAPYLAGTAGADFHRFDKVKAKKGIHGSSPSATAGGDGKKSGNSSTSLYLSAGQCLTPAFWLAPPASQPRHELPAPRRRDIVRLSMVLGHRITTTQRYLVTLLTEDLSASHQKVSDLESVG